MPKVILGGLQGLKNSAVPDVGAPEVTRRPLSEDELMLVGESAPPTGAAVTPSG